MRDGIKEQIEYLLARLLLATFGFMPRKMAATAGCDYMLEGAVR